MLSLPGSDVGFQAAYSLSFETLPSSDGLPSPPPPIPLPTIVPVSSDYFEGDVTIEMDGTEGAHRFTICIYGLTDAIYALLIPESTIVHITLGYDDGNSTEVMTGLLTDTRVVAGDQWYETTLTGVDFVFDRLQRPVKHVDANYQGQTVGATATAICQLANVSTQIPDNGPTLDTVTFVGKTPLEALRELAAFAQFSLQAKDGKLWMGDPDSLGVTQITPIDDGATSMPLVIRGAKAAASLMDGQDFDIAGIPALRPNDVVTLGTSTYRIQHITHKLTRYGGYICTGRALSPGATSDDAQKAGKPSASLVARQISQNLRRRERNRPAVDIGDVNAYNAGAGTATFNLGYDAAPAVVSPTVQATLRETPVPLSNKPIASPFALDNCGLVVPVYPGMRSLLLHRWNEPEDAVSAGFVWTGAMTPPPSQAGDWWLCLPTQVDANGTPSGPAVNDLTTQDGLRVIEVAGMTLNIGSGLLSDLGARPTPGSDGTLTIQSDDNKTQITLEQGQITMTDGTATVTVGNGQVQMTDGTVTLTIGGGKVSIGS